MAQTFGHSRCAFLCGGGGKPACPATGGTVTGAIRAADGIGPAGQGIAAGEFAELVRAMRAGKTYANVHTSPTYAGGEIRGQIGRNKTSGRWMRAGRVFPARLASRPGLERR